MGPDLTGLSYHNPTEGFLLLLQPLCDVTVKALELQS